MAYKYIICLLALLYIPLQAQHVSLKVQVVDAETELPLADAYVKIAKKGIFTNALGWVEFVNKTPGTYTVLCTYASYRDTAFLLKLDADTSIYLALTPRNVLLTEAEVFGGQSASADDVMRNEVLKTSIAAKDLQSGAVLLGELDMLKPLTALPGVQAGSPGGTGIYVRGGDLYHNAMFIDGVPLYNLNHGFGYVSPFVTGGVQKMDFYKQGFPARYQGALSSVMDVSLKQASFNKWHGMAAGGFGAFSGSLGIPVIKDKLSVQLSARYSTIGLVQEIAESIEEPVPDLFGFEDYSVKVNYQIGKREKLELIGYLSKDNLYKKEESLVNYDIYKRVQTPLVSLKYSKLGTKFYQEHQLYSSTYSFDYSKFKRQGFDPSLPDFIQQEYLYNTHLTHSGYKNIFSKSLGRLNYSFGGEVMWFSQQLPESMLSTSGGTVKKRGEITNLIVPSVFAEGSYALSDLYDLSGGVRLSYLTEDVERWPMALEPHVMLSYKPHQKWAFFAGYDRGALFVHRFRNNTFGSALDVPVLAYDSLPYATSDQLVLGGVYKSGDFNVNAAVFYRYLHNVTDRDYNQPINIYTPDVEMNPSEELQAGLLPVNGHSYGAELGGSYIKGVFTFNGGYTWSKSKRISEDINNGNYYPFEFNREHSFNLNGVVRFKMNKINKITEIGMGYNYGTGNFTQFPLQGQLVPGTNSSVIGFIGNRNDVQLPAIQHLDVVFNFISKKRIGVRTFSISIFNVLATPIVTNYNSSNPVADTERTTIRATGPIRIFPSFSYRYEF